MGPVKIPIDGVLDLHTFHPRDLQPLLDDYLEACCQARVCSLRIIHGKGRGILRRKVHGLLAKHNLVKSFAEAPPEAGGWGATIVELKCDKFVE